jgi:hypothetical protein
MPSHDSPEFCQSISDSLSNPIVFALLDRRVLLSLEQVTQEVRHLTGESLTFSDLTYMGECGWIPIF